MIKNLVFYLYPIKGSTWEFHAKQLRHYWDIFNGKKIITLSLDERTVPPEQVYAAFDLKDIQWRLVTNDPKLGETAAFPGILECVQSNNSSEVTFYAHGKGAGYMDLAKRIWCETMYYFNLGSNALTEKILSEYDSLGCYRHSHSNHGGGKWHYSGTFFWFQHGAIFTKNWKDIEPTNYGVEGWPGRHIPLDRSFSVIEPPDFPSFVDQWRPIQQLASISRWDPETAIGRFSAIDAGTSAWMRRLMSKFMIDEEIPKRPKYADHEFVTNRG